MQVTSISFSKIAFALLLALVWGSGAKADYVQGDWENRNGKVYDFLSWDGGGNATFRHTKREGRSAIRLTTYTYANLAASGNVPNAMDIDLTFIREEITASEAEDVRIFNTIVKCGFDDWVGGVAKDVTATICCPRSAAELEYQVVKVLWGVYFYLGERDRYYDGTVAASRVRNLNLDFTIDTRRLDVDRPFGFLNF